MIKFFQDLFGIQVTEITRDEAAQEILTRPVTIQYRPTIIEMDRKVNEVQYLNEPVILIDSVTDPSSN